MGSDPRTDRTWTLWRCPECGHTRFYEHGDPDQPCCNHSPACRQRSMTRVSVVEVSRLREAEADLRCTKGAVETAIQRFKRAEARAERLEAELREAGDTFSELAIYLEPDEGKTHNADACGIDACIFCLAQARAGKARDRARGVLDGGGDGE